MLELEQEQIKFLCDNTSITSNSIPVKENRTMNLQCSNLEN